MARVEPGDPLGDYVRARVAAQDGAFEQASASYAAALAAAPDNEVVASEALSHAVNAGDWPLALRALETLEQDGDLLPDARFLRVGQAFRERDWREAQRQIDAVEREQVFAFTAPVLRAWLAFGSRRGDPLAILAGAEEGSGAAAAYAGEHRRLLLAAMGRGDEARRLIEGANPAGPRSVRLRIAAAGALARRHRDDALALLQGDDPSLAAARALVEARRPVPGAVDDAAAGVAELMMRISLDMVARDLAAVAGSFARIATWLAPDNSQAWMVSAELMARRDRHGAAVALLENVGPRDPFAEMARDQKVRLLVQGGNGAQALTEARAVAREGEPDVADLIRLGEVLMEQDRAPEAAQAYARAIEAYARNPDENQPEWTLWLSKGAAHDRAGEWPDARAALERAYALAPDEPLVLNYLGYAQLVHRENMEEAERLVREAHRLAPDNAAITDSLGWALFLKGEVPEAITLLERAVEGEPADVEINEHLGDAYFTAGRRIEARFAWRAARVYAEGEDAERLDAKIERGLTPRLAAR